MIVPREIESYCIDHSAPAPSFFQDLDRETREFAPDVHGMQVGPLEGAFLTFLVRSIGARRVLEFGTFTGCSSLHLALALPEDGLLTTLEKDIRPLPIARKYWALAGVERKIESIVEDARTSSLRLAEEIAGGRRAPYDLAFIDADKIGYESYFEAALRCVRAGGVILADNVLWGGKVLSPQEHSDRVIHAFNEKFSRDPRVESILLPLRDGLSCFRVR